MQTPPTPQTLPAPQILQTLPTESLVGFESRLSAYLPTLTAGLFVVLLGIVVGWLVKRAVIRMLVIMRLDRLGGPFAWRAAFRKGDVRRALFEMIGNIVMGLVILLFLDNATQIWGLTVVGRLIDVVLFALPNIALVALIVAIGVLLSNTLSDRVEHTLEEEGLAHPRLIAKGLKGALLSLVGALALWQLNFAREIVLAAFLIAFGAIGVAFALAVGMGAAKAIQHGLQGVFERKRDE